MMESVVNAMVMVPHAVVVVMPHAVMVVMPHAVMVVMPHAVVCPVTRPPVPSSATRHCSCRSGAKLKRGIRVSAEEVGHDVTFKLHLALACTITHAYKHSLR